MDPTPRETVPEPTVPELTVGTHLSPRDGACLMEVVSRAAGQPWSDSPGCTHPLLGHLARLVNDASSDPARQRLLDLVPALRVASSPDPRTAPRLALACTERALRDRPTLWLAHLHRAAARQLDREQSRADGPVGPVGRVRRRLFEHGPAVRAVEAAVLALGALPGPQRDTALAELLGTGLCAVGLGESPDLAAPLIQMS